ncbi:MAG: yabJ [Parachlamydiales bacterium]|nr:yabJ [Parachlamydiales bacterium]
MRKTEKIYSEHAPKAIGPYSQGIKAGEYVFVSGQLPIDPKTDQLISGDIEAMTHKVIDHLEAILASAHLTLEHVVKTDVFLKDLAQFPAFNRTYGERFNHSPPPARQTIQVAKLPLDSPIEISCIAYRPKNH